MKEVWKEIVGYEGYYEVSNMGNVRSMDRIIYKSDNTIQTYKSKPITIHYNKRLNVYEVSLRKDGIKRCLKVHRLVAQAFCYNDDPINKIIVNHIDGDRSNNKSVNLEWCTYSYNEKHAYDYLNRPVNSTKGKKRGRLCISINKLKNEIIEHKSIAEASRYTNISETQIRRIANKECVNKLYDFILENY